MKTPPFLLTMPQYNGTLAAARCLGEHGVPVTVAGSDFTAPTRWSRYVTRRITAPDPADAERFLDWLFEFGAREPGHVLYPTCDELVWLIASRADELARHFKLYQPGERTILQLLDKKALHEACAELDIPTLPTAFPQNVDDALEAGRDLGYPLLLKPRTQILLTTRSKGNVADRPDSLRREYASFIDRDRFHPWLAAAVPGVEHPMLQAFRPEAAQGIYSVAGFIGPEDGAVVARGAMKILQRPKRLGVGLCFEEAPVDPAVLESLVRLCRKVGYYGVFEAEFVPEKGRLHLLDFNPRFYGQMGFETGRALPLGYMVWLAASGDPEQLARVVAEAQAWQEGRGYIYCHGFFLKMVIALRRLSGRMQPEEARHWLQWIASRKSAELAVDATDTAADRLPGLASAAHEVYRAFRHPRSFLMTIVLDP